jgi:hypothetical protein
MQQPTENDNIFVKAKGQAYPSFLKATPCKFANDWTLTLQFEKIPIIMQEKNLLSKQVNL